MYDTREEINQKIAGSVVLFNDSPVYVEEGVQTRDKKLHVKYHHLETGEHRQNLLSESGWNFRDLGSRLGYMNVDMGVESYQEATYCTRIPIRHVQSCQGISAKNIQIPYLRGNKSIGLSTYPVKFQNVYNTRGFVCMMRKMYPTYLDVVKSFDLSKYLTSQAFSRQYAVNRGNSVGPFYLEYRGKDIGYSDDMYRWKVSKDFGHLRETLEYMDLKVV